MDAKKGSSENAAVANSGVFVAVGVSNVFAF